MFLWILASLSIAHPLFAQTLDEAIANQLDFAPAPCQGLLEGMPTSVLNQPLRTICNRGISAPGNPSSSGGSSNATPIAFPSIVQKQLREPRKKKDKFKKIEGASADSVVELDSGINLFIAAEYEALNRDITRFLDGYDSDLSRVTAGADYQFTRNILAGLAIDYAHHEGDFVNGGGFKNESLGVLAFGSFIPFEHVFLQVTAGYAYKMYDRDRVAKFTEPASTINVNGIANADHNADEVRAGTLIGYNYSIGNVLISPRMGVDFLHIDFDTYSEIGSTGLELTFHDDEVTSFQTRLGLQASTVLPTGWGVIVPQVGFDWMHEFENDQRDIVISFVDDTRSKPFTFQNERPDRDWMQVNAGATMVLKNKTQIFANYRTLLGHSFFDSHAATIGVRFPL